MKFIRSFSLAGLVLSGLIFCAPISAFAADSVTIEHNSPGKIGRWVLYYPNGVLKDDDINVNKKKQTVHPTAGELTLSVVPPDGSTVTISIYQDDELVKKQQIQQLSVSSKEGHSYRFYVQYAFTKQGTIGVTSSPSGVLIRLKAPNGKRYLGRTPKTFERMYTGRYTITANAVPGCAAPRPYTKELRDGERLVVHIDLPCDLAKRRPAEDKPLISRRELKQGLDDSAAERAAKRKEAQDLMRKAPVGSGSTVAP